MSFTTPLSTVIAENFNGLLSTAPHWERVRLGDLATITNGVPLPSPGFNPTKGPPVVRIRNVLDGSTDTYFDGEVEDSWFISPGDLLVGMDGDFHPARWRGPRALLNQRVCKVAPKDERVSTEYLSYILPGYLEAVNKHTPSITVKHLSSRTMAELPIPVPPRVELDELVAQLETQFSRLDAATATLTRLKAEVKRTRAAVLKAAVEGKLVPTEAALAKAEEREYEPASVAIRQLLAERKSRWAATNVRGTYREPRKPAPAEERNLPEGWTWIAMDALLDGINAGKSFVADNRPPQAAEVGLVKIGAVTWGAYDEMDSKTVLNSSQVDPTYFIERGDLLLSRANTVEFVGAVAIAETVTRHIMLSDKILRLRLPVELRRWVLWVLRSVHGRREIESRATGNQASMYNIGQDRIRQVAIPFPPAAERVRLVERIEHWMSILDRLDATLDASIARANRLRQGILKRAFEGQLIPSRHPRAQ